ncbi:MAG: 16S rRNA (cytosine(1402)-N(4))-methyltransferase RsmH [Alphaproteobacteria bacterium]
MMEPAETVHKPVLLNEVLAVLDPVAGKTYVDGTFGAGGYTKAILEKSPCIVYGIDRDPDAVDRAQALRKTYPRFHIIEGNFADMDHLMSETVHPKVDGVVLDLGVSSPQLDQADRGFSFQKDGPLDMRMEKSGVTAAQVVNTYSEERLAHIIWSYGDEKKSKQIAKRIVNDRVKTPFTSTLQLAKVIHETLGHKDPRKIDPATKTFQALRIFVNEEMGSLKKGLRAAEKILNPGGHLIVVSFHSLEDREVKTFLQTRSGKKSNPSRYDPRPNTPDSLPSTFQLIDKKSMAPSMKEVRDNPRSRSAKLRWALRTTAPAWPFEEDLS